MISSPPSHAADPGSDALTEVVHRLQTTPFDACDSTGLATASELVNRLQGFVDSCTDQIARRARVLHEQGRSARPAEVLARHRHLSGRDARRAEARSDTLAHAPALADALGLGAISSAHADGLAAAASGLDDEHRRELFSHDLDLAARAATESPERFAERCRRLAASLLADEGAEQFDHDRRQTRLSTFVNPRTGRYVLNGEFDPELGAIVATAIADEVRALLYANEPITATDIVPALRHDPEHLAAHALVNLLKGGVSRRRGTAADLQVLIDYETFTRGTHSDTECQTGHGHAFPAAAARRLACNAAITLSVLGADGDVLDQGSLRRSPTRVQRRALRAMYPTCGWSDCTVPFHRCELHHIVPWEHCGPTDLDNLLPLCVGHHHQAHEGGWTIDLLPGRILVIHRPDGAHHADVPLRRSGRHAPRHLHHPLHPAPPPDLPSAELPLVELPLVEPPPGRRRTGDQRGAALVE